jgi:hypothetical protein
VSASSETIKSTSRQPTHLQHQAEAASGHFGKRKIKKEDLHDKKANPQHKSSANQLPRAGWRLLQVRRKCCRGGKKVAFVSRVLR